MIGNFTHMPIMSGFTHDEYNLFTAIQKFLSSPPQKPISEAKVTNYVQTTYGANTAGALAVYKPNSCPTSQLALDAIGTSSIDCPQYAINQALSSQIPVYAHEFYDVIVPSYFPAMPGFQPLAYHTADIQYLFPLWYGGSNGIPHPLNDQQERLSDELVAWT